jgi:hypothetical protein
MNQTLPFHGFRSTLSATHLYRKALSVCVASRIKRHTSLTPFLRIHFGTPSSSHFYLPPDNLLQLGIADFLRDQSRVYKPLPTSRPPHNLGWQLQVDTQRERVRVRSTVMLSHFLWSSNGKLILATLNRQTAGKSRSL